MRCCDVLQQQGKCKRSLLWADLCALTVQGCIDENTLVWGQGLYDWLPAKNVKLLLPMIRTPEGEGMFSIE